MARKKLGTSPSSSSFAPLTERDISDQTDNGSFSRGRAYYRQDRIQNPVIRDGTLQAQCVGSDVMPYRVRATLLPQGESGENPRDASCTCPRGGFCKHIVALLLTWIDSPEQFIARPPLAEALAGKSPEDLIALIERMVQRYPELERLVELPLPVRADAIDAAGPNEVTIDAAVIRDQVESCFVDADPYSHDGYDRYGWDDLVAYHPDRLNTILELGESYGAAGQWANAQVVFTALAEITGGFMLEASDEQGELSSLMIACDKGMTACLDAQSTLPETDQRVGEPRQALIRTLYELWTFDVLELGGIDVSREGPGAIVRNASVEERAMVDGWLRAENADSHWVKRAVVGFRSMLREADEASDEEILALYQEVELWDDVAVLMVQMDRIDEAIAMAARYLRQPNVLIHFANVLVARGGEAVDRAISLVDDRLWETEGADSHQEVTLRQWLKNQYSIHGRPREALAMAEHLFRKHPTLQHFTDVQHAAHLPEQPGDAWEELRAELIMHLRTKKEWTVLIDIHLRDGNGKAALDAFDQRVKQGQGARHGAAGFAAYPEREVEIAKAIEAEVPDRAVEIYCRKAEREIMTKNRSSYKVAAGHLLRTKETLERHGRKEEWRAIIKDVRDSNKTLRALREELDNLGL